MSASMLLWVNAAAESSVALSDGALHHLPTVV
jgi:hypothetical protein